MGTTTIFSFVYQSCVWPHSDQLFWENPCSVWNSGIDLVVALEYNFFQPCSSAEQISVRFARFRRSYFKHTPVFLTSHTSCFYLICAALFKVATFHFLQLIVSNVIVFVLPVFVEHTSCMLLTPMWVSIQIDENMWNSYP